MQVNLVFASTNIKTHYMMKKRNTTIFCFVLIALLSLHFNCKKKGDGNTPNPEPQGATINWWLTRGNLTTLLQKQNPIVFAGGNPSTPLIIDVDSTQRYQTIDGFGFTLTEGSAYLINKLSTTERAALLQELFGKGENDISINYLRLGMGATDLSTKVYTYNDLPNGQTDVPLANFSLGQDEVDVIPVLKQILAINPNIKIMATPWTAPVWMKDNNNSVGGSLLPQYYSVYAQYFVKYIQQMQAKGITVHAITPQNEPLHGGNNPSMVMTAVQQLDFIKNHLGPAFQSAGITAKIVVYDHNCDRPDYPMTILSDAAARQYVDGSAFHLYAGDITALETVHNAHPDKNLYFTEQWTGASGNFEGDLKWHIRNVVIGSMRNWSKAALNWNLANDGLYDPHTPGGCDQCKGAITLNGGVLRNVGYYIIGHASKFVPQGSVRISSNNVGNLYSVAFVTPAGNKVLILLNDGSNNVNFSIRYKGQSAGTSIPGNSVVTYVW
jgi:glucosylceramidase